MAQALGLISVVWNGNKIPIEKGGTFTNGGLRQKGIVTGQQVDASNEFMQGKASVTTKLLRGTVLGKIFIAGQNELQVQCDTGQTYVAPDAFITNMPNFTAGDGGKVKIEWEFGVAAEVLNG